MKIEKIAESRLVTDNLNIEELQFGRIFSDHLLISTYKDGQWSEPIIQPHGKALFPPTIMALHYGQAVFEGMKAYRNNEEEVFLFRPEKNFHRLNASAKRLAMPEVTEEIFMGGLTTLIDMERNWIPKKVGSSLYIRPFIFASERALSARISEEYTFCILCSVANNYYNKPLRVKIAQKYSRAAQGGVGYAKAAGNYAASFYPTFLAKEEGYDQLIWTDDVEHEYIEESGTMNVFVRINNTLVTPPTSEKILEGVTRDSVIQIARKKGITVEERPITKTEVYQAHTNGTLKEIFGCGTAVIINRFEAIMYPQESLELPDLQDDESYAYQIKDELLSIQNGTIEDPFGWRVKV